MIHAGFTSGLRPFVATIDWTNTNAGANNVIGFTFSAGGILTLTGNGVLTGASANQYPTWYRAANVAANNYGAPFEIQTTSAGFGGGSANNTWLALTSDRSWTATLIYFGGPASFNPSTTVQIRSLATAQVLATYTMQGHGVTTA